MQDYELIEFWLPLAAEIMRNVNQSQIEINHLAIAACLLDRPAERPRRGLLPEQVRLQSGRVMRALAVFGWLPEQFATGLLGKLKQGAARCRTEEVKEFKFGPGVVEMLQRAKMLAKPGEREAVYYLAAAMENPTREMLSLLAEAGIKHEELRNVLLSLSPRCVNQGFAFTETTIDLREADEVCHVHIEFSSSSDFASWCKTHEFLFEDRLVDAGHTLSGGRGVDVRKRFIGSGGTSFAGVNAYSEQSIDLRSAGCLSSIQSELIRFCKLVAVASAKYSIVLSGKNCGTVEDWANLLTGS